MGHAPAGLFGYSHLTGHYPGGQAEYLRVPYADVSPLKIENDSLTDEQVLFLSDIFPTGYMAAENAEIEAGRHGGGLGLRAGRPVCDSKRLDVRRRPGDRDRPGAGAPRDGAKTRASRR